MKPHKEYRSAIVFCWWPTPVWCADYIRDGGVWLRRAEKRTYRNGRVKFFRIGAAPLTANDVPHGLSGTKEFVAASVTSNVGPASLSGLTSVADRKAGRA